MKKRLTIGLMIGSTSDPYQATIWNGISEQANKSDVNLITFCGDSLDMSNPFSIQKVEIFKLASEKNIDVAIILTGALLCYTSINELQSMFKDLFKIPVISLGVPIPVCPSITVDNRSGMKGIVEHIVLHHNKRKIAYIGGPQTNEEAQVRLSVVQEVLTTHNIPFFENQIYHGHFIPKDGEKGIEEFIDIRNIDFDALICANDDAAIRACKELQKRGFAIPEDVIISGFDDIEECVSNVPSISTVKQPLYELGVRAVALALDITKKNVPLKQEIPTSIVLRHSCGCLVNNSLSEVNKNKLHDYFVTSYNDNYIHDELIEFFTVEYYDKISSNLYSIFTEILRNIIKKGFLTIKSNNVNPFILDIQKNIDRGEKAGILFPYIEKLVISLVTSLLDFFSSQVSISFSNALWSSLYEILSTHRVQYHSMKDTITWGSHEFGTLLHGFKMNASDDVICTNLDSLHISSCYFSLYTKNFNEVVSKFCYNRNHQHNIDRTLKYSSSDLIPDGMSSISRRFSYTVLPALFGDEIIGFVLLETKAFMPKIVEAIATKLTTTFKGRTLVETIKEHASTLEKKVQLRTDQIHKNEIRIRSLLESSPDYISTLDSDFKILYINKDGFGSSRNHSVVHHNFLEYIHKSFIPSFREKIKKIYKTDTIQVVDTIMNLHETQEIWYRHRITLEKSESSLKSIMVISTDITKQKDVEAAYIASREEAEKANKIKSIFLANMSHEIRTPLNGIIGNAELSLATSDIKNSYKYNNTILKESEHLLHLINDILDHEKIVAGKLNLELISFDVYKVVSTIVNISEPTTKSKGLELVLDIDPSVSSKLVGDPLRLRQILLNLVSNAVKFTSKGFVTIKVKNILTENNTQKLYFAVVDTGIGISKGRQKQIFESYTQADQSTTREYGGTGLGTTIAARLVTLMGGTLALDSVEGKGSTFFFEIILRQSDVEISNNDIFPENSDISLSGSGDVLVAEDYPVNQQVIRNHLEGSGYTVIIVENGAEAVQLSKQKKFDLILMDMQMPILGGDMATERIRSGESPNKKTPIIGLTANADLVSKEICFTAGMNEVMTKPIRRNVLLRGVKKWIETGNSKDYCIGEKSISVSSQLAIPPLDYTTLEEEFGDISLAQEIISQFLINVKSQIFTLKNALISTDYQKIKTEAHSIKGGAGTIEAIPLYNSADKLERFCKDYENDITISKGVDEVVETFEKLQVYIDEHE